MKPKVLRDVNLSTEEMRAFLGRFPTMPAPTRRLTETGQATFTDADGTRYRAPLTAVDDGPTHFARAKLVTTRIQGETKQWNN